MQLLFFQVNLFAQLTFVQVNPSVLSNAYSSIPVCPSNDCQSKPVSPVNVCLQNPCFVIKNLIFNLFLVLLLFSTYFKLSIVTLNIFIDLILLKVIFLTNFTCLRERLIFFVSPHGSYLRSMLDTVIIFQFFRTMFKISTSDVSFFTRLLSIFAMFNNIVLNFTNKISFSNICRNVLILR